MSLITGGDSGIGRAVATAFAKEGADVAIVYLRHDEDAEETRQRIEQEGRRCVTLRGDVGDEAFCRQAIDKTVEAFGKLDVLVNNAGEQEVENQFEDISKEQLERTFRTNIFSMFYITQAALKHLPDGAAIVNTTSVTAYRGNPNLIDYSSTKRRDCRFHAVAFQSLGRTRYSGQRRCARTNMDPSDSFHLSTRKARAIWQDNANEAARPTGRSCSMLRLSSLSRRFLHHRPSAPPQRRRGRQRMKRNT